MDAAPPLPLGDSSAQVPLFERDRHTPVAEIFIRAGEPIGFVLDECRQLLELDANFAKVAPSKIRMFASCIKDLVTKTIPGSIATVEIRLLLRLDQRISRATPELRIRFAYCEEASGEVRALERRLRALLDLVGSTSEEIWTTPATTILPNDMKAGHVVALAQQLRRSAPGAAIAPGVEVASAQFGAPVRVPEIIGGAPSLNEVGEKIIDAVGEVVGYDRQERIVHVLFRGRQASTALTADMERVFETVRQQAPIAGNRCRLRYVSGNSQKVQAIGKLLEIVVESRGLFADTPD
ncbi:hypothetical protein [Rubrivivax sp. JA1026]|uniref:hypothetical protein n=1 Tax=Rubrivivax sp. JA1026 TaxID=2710888 RepID=UPI0013E94BA3|nr:hypothetical protein [Rubrivivax sp. JA1026]